MLSRHRIRFVILAVLAAGLAGAAAPGTAWPAVWEKYLLVIPPQPMDTQQKGRFWFGRTVRTVFTQASGLLDTLVYLKNDELRGLRQAYGFAAEAAPEPGMLERLADEKEMAVFYGRYVFTESRIRLQCRLVPGRNDETRRFVVEFDRERPSAGYAETVTTVVRLLNLEVPGARLRAIAALPGTESLRALRFFTQAWNEMALRYENTEVCARALPKLQLALKADPDFAPALALRVHALLVTTRNAERTCARRPSNKSGVICKRRPPPRRTTRGCRTSAWRRCSPSTTWPGPSSWGNAWSRTTR